MNDQPEHDKTIFVLFIASLSRSVWFAFEFKQPTLSNTFLLKRHYNLINLNKFCEKRDTIL